MSRQLPGEQVEHAFSSHRLCNWQKPREDKKGLKSTNGESRFGTLKPRTGKTSFIVNDKGYLQEIPGTTKISNAFVHQLPVTHKSPARWPQENAAIKYAPRATMGYKGIQTSYLPTSTVSLKTCEIPGSTEFNYNFR